MQPITSTDRPTTQEGYRYIGKAVEKVGAVERLTGKALFGADFFLPGMLYGKVLRSPYPHARLKGIDAAGALGCPGVKGVVTARDLPPLGEMGRAVEGEFPIALRDYRRLVLAHEKVLFDGHAVAAVAATSLEAAEDALGRIHVDYEPLPAVENAAQAVAADAPLLHEDLFTQTPGANASKPSNLARSWTWEQGVLEEGFRQAAIIVEGEYETAMAHQGYLEPQACLASSDPDGRITLWTCTGGIFNAQLLLSAILDIPQDALTVVAAEVGGSFGGKNYVYLEPLAILLARQTGRPVKMVMDRAEVLRGTGPNPPVRCRIKVGASRDGRLTGCAADVLLDVGAFPGVAGSSAPLASFVPYKLDNFKIDACEVVTNKPRVQGCRAPGGLQVSFAVETALDELAEGLGIDPLKLRLVNAVAEGDPMPNGQPHDRIGFKEILTRVAVHPSWTTPLQGPNRGRGLAVGFWPTSPRPASALVLVHLDGTVTVSSGQVDVAGVRTIMRQIVAEELQQPLDAVSVKVADTSTAPHTAPAGGNRSTYIMSAALQQACATVLEQMRGHAAAQMKIPLARVHYTEGKFRAKDNPGHVMSWSDVARLTVLSGAGPVVGQGTASNLPSLPTFAAHVADVEVDPETGQCQLLHYTCFQDVGRAINPLLVEGQLQGGAQQGVGWTLFESYHYQDGRLCNPNFLDYRMPSALDLPVIDPVIVEVPASAGPYGARGVGEVSIVPTAGAIANAVYRAAGVRLRKLPMTAEAIFRSLRQGPRAAGSAPTR